MNRRTERGYTMKQAAELLGTTQPTLRKHIKRAGIEVKHDPHDYRVRLLHAGQIEQLREILSRNKR